MTIEHAHAHSLPKPWGVVDPRPWSNAGDDVNTIGEIWYERSNSTAVPPLLLLKLRFDAVFAQSDHVNISAGRNGLVGLVAHTDRLILQLLKCVDMETTQ